MSASWRLPQLCVFVVLLPVWEEFTRHIEKILGIGPAFCFLLGEVVL